MIVTGCVLAVVLAACQQGNEPNSSSGRNRFGYHGTAGNGTQTQYATPTPTPSAYATPSPTPEESISVSASPTPAAGAKSSPTSREMAYGTPVPGKPGFVTSPHSPYAGYVDVRGFPPGTEVKCPYSGKIFLVP